LLTNAELEGGVQVLHIGCIDLKSANKIQVALRASLFTSGCSGGRPHKRAFSVRSGKRRLRAKR
jgi:hypothetical protein